MRHVWLAAIAATGLFANPLVAVETIMVPMRDGTRLATDIHLPPGDGPFPVVLVRTVYGRASDKFGPSVAAKGLACVLQDTRGYGSSEGQKMLFSADGWGTMADGEDTVTWVKQQPWCNGRIGTWGVSALGITQVLLAPTTGDVRCQFIGLAPSNLFDVFMHGGVPQKQLSERYAKMMGHQQAFEQRRAHMSYDDYWRRLDGQSRATDVTAPAVHVGGWFDLYPQGAIDNFVSRQYFGGPGARGNQKLIVGPWEHGITDKVGDLQFPDHRFDYSRYAWRFFDYWLRDEPNSVMELPAVNYYVLGDCDDPHAPGNEWRTADAWPPFPTRRTSFYLHADGVLRRTPPSRADGQRTYTFNPADPFPSLGGDNAMKPLPLDQRPALARGDVLAFATEPLTEPLEATGAVQVKLHVSSDAPDTDFVAKLVDIYPDGRQIAIASGIRRLKFHGGFERPDPLPPGTIAELSIDCWSTSIVFNRQHRIGLLIASSDWPRFEVNPNTGDDLPRYSGEANPQGDLAIDPASLRTARNTVYLSSAHLSELVLPVRAVASAPGQADNRSRANGAVASQAAANDLAPRSPEEPRGTPVTNESSRPAGSKDSKRAKPTRLSKPRIHPLTKEAWSDAQREILEPFERTNRLHNVFTTIANHPKLARDWLTFATYVLRDNSLPVRDREILILRIGCLCHADYELAQHARIGKRVGLSDDELRRIAAGPDAPGWSEHERLLLVATDELHADAFISDATWNGLAKIYSKEQMMDLVFTVGEYNMVSMALNSFGVQLDEGLAPFPAEK